MSGSDRPVISLEIQDQISPGAKAAADALNKVGDAAVAVETKLGKVSATASALVNRFDPATKSALALEKAQRQLSDATETLARSVAAGDTTQTQASSTLATLQQRVRSLADAHDNGLTPAMHRTSLSLGQVAPQFIQFFSSIQGGINPLVAVTQQGHQLADQMLVTGTSVSQLASTIGGGLKTALAAILSPIGLAVTGAALFAGGVYAVGSAAFSAQARLGDLRQGLQAYGQDATTIVSVSNDLAKSTGLSRSALDDLGKSLSTGIQNFQATGVQLKNLELLTQNFGAATGQTLEQAAAGIKAAFGDPSREALKLMQDGVRGFTGDLVANVTALQNQGQTAAASNLVLTTLGKATKDAALPVTDFGKAWRDLKIAVDGGSGSLTDALAKLGTPLVSALTDVTHAATTMANVLSSIHLPDWVTKVLGNSVTGAINPIGGLIGTIGSLTGGTPTAAPTPNASIAPHLSAAAAAYGIDPALLARLQAAEGVQNPDGSWQTSPTGAVGPMQVTNTTFRGIASQPGTFNALGLTNNTDVGQNVQAGAALFAHLLNKYGDPALAVLAYHDGEPLIDQVLAGKGSPSQAAQDEARKVLSGYSGTGLTGVSSSGQPINVSGALPTAGPTPADEGLLDSKDAATFANDYAKASTTVNDLVAAEAQLRAENKTSGLVWDSLEQRLQAARQQLEATYTPLQTLLQPIQQNTVALKAEADAWVNGASAVARATLQQQAYTDARKIAATTDTNFKSIQADIYDTLLKQAQLQATDAAAQESSKNADQLTFLNAEVKTLGQDYDTRQKILAALQEKQALEQSGKQYDDATKQRLIDQKVALVGVTDQLQVMQSSLQEVGNFGVQIFDQVGSAITNAFISGQGAAINFGSILKSVAGIALQELGKLAIGNVLSNAIGGTNLPTIGTVFSALTGGGGTTSAGGGGGSSVLGTLSNGSSLVSGVNTLSGGWLGNALGITGPNGLLSQLGLGGTGSGSSLFSGTGFFGSQGTIAGIANTPLFGSATVGSALGGVGAGYGLGSLAGGYLQSALGKTGSAPQIGAGVGALAGAAIGSIIPGLGTLLGGALGGLLGGAGGGLIGPHKATPYSSFGINLQGTQGTGTLVPGKVLSQGEDTTAEQAQFSQDVSALNDLLIKAGIKLTGLGGVTQVGNPIAPGETDKVASLSAAISRFTFSVPDTSTDEGRVLASQINGKSFSGVDQLQAVFNEVDTFINQTVPALTKQATDIGSFGNALANLHSVFDPAITEAQKLGYAESDLTNARDKAIATVETQINAQLTSERTGYQASYLSAKAQVTGSSQDAETAALYSFDNVSAPQARQQLVSEYQSIFGDAYATTQDYVDSSTQLEKTLGEQRLAIQSQYNNQITTTAQQSANQAAQAAGASITSLLSYIQKLQGASTSPLSASDQYSLASRQFNAVSGAARAGDYTSISNLPTYADAFLSASRAVNGSGAGYVNDYSTVLTSVSSVANLGADALTQSFMAAQLQNQTAAIVSSQAQLANLLQSILSAMTTNTLAPSRIAA